MKKSLLILLGIILCSSLVLAQSYKIEISTVKERFEAGENITLKVTLLDLDNKLVNDNIQITLEDAEKNIKVEKIIPSNEFTEINIPGASYGQGTIIATYGDSETKGTFLIEVKELAKFEIEGDQLIVTNIGNTQYTRTIQITIGEITGIKTPKLGINKKISYRLVAPEGTYSIKVSDGKTTLTKSEVRLTGTGQVVGAIDETATSRSGITGGISPDEESEQGLLGYVKESKFVYIFVLVIFGATILLAIERRFKKKVNQ